MKSDILAILESKISNKIEDNVIKIEGYNIYRSDRSVNGGGVLIYYKESKLGQYKGFKAAWINIVARSQTWLLRVVYHPPKDTAFYDKLDKVLEKVWLKRKNMIMLGDFHSDLYMKGKSKDDTYYGKCLLKVLNRCGLKILLLSQRV